MRYSKFPPKSVKAMRISHEKFFWIIWNLMDDQERPKRSYNQRFRHDDPNSKS